MQQQILFFIFRGGRGLWGRIWRWRHVSNISPEAIIARKEQLAWNAAIIQNFDQN
uniref:Uncharacterized protein n=1 Tax=Meloidogyne incognita TaxID=6306 RepID=A0A914KFV2_MELIC